MKTIQFAALLAITSLLVSCATPPRNQDDGSSVDAEVGVYGCAECTGVRTFTSRTLASELHAVKDARNLNTGQRISASIQLSISNRKSGLKDGRSASPSAMAYLREITGSVAHMFEGEVQTDANHPYRFLLHMHHNSSFMAQDVYLVTAENVYVLLPPMILEGVQSKQSCFSTGCVWDADYILSSKVISNHIFTGRPLTIFVGNRVSRQVQSKDGLNAAYETGNSGPVLQIAPEKLRTFVATVRQKLGLQPGG